MKAKENDVSKLKSKYESSFNRKTIDIEKDKIEDLSFLHSLLCTAASEDYLFTLSSFTGEGNSADFSCYSVKIEDSLYGLVLVSIPVIERTSKSISSKVIDIFDFLEKTFFNLDYLKAFQDTNNKYVYVVCLKCINKEDD
jgi:hypothetical protein